MRVGFAISITTKIAWILVFWPKWFKILSYYDWIWINFDQILKYWKKSENCRGDLCLSALSKTTEIPNTGWEIKMNTWKHNGNEAKFRGQKILLKYAHADFGPVTDSISSLSLNPWPNPNSPSSPSNGETGRRAHRIGPKSRCPNPNRPRIPDPAPTPDDWFSLFFFSNCKFKLRRRSQPPLLYRSLPALSWPWRGKRPPSTCYAASSGASTAAAASTRRGCRGSSTRPWAWASTRPSPCCRTCCCCRRRRRCRATSWAPSRGRSTSWRICSTTSTSTPASGADPAAAPPGRWVNLD